MTVTFSINLTDLLVEVCFKNICMIPLEKVVLPGVGNYSFQIIIEMIFCIGGCRSRRLLFQRGIGIEGAFNAYVLSITLNVITGNLATTAELLFEDSCLFGIMGMVVAYYNEKRDLRNFAVVVTGINK